MGVRVAPPRANAEGADAILVRIGAASRAGIKNYFCILGNDSFNAPRNFRAMKGFNPYGFPYTPAPHKAPIAPGACCGPGCVADAARGRRLSPPSPE